LQYLRYELANILSQTPFGKGRADEARAIASAGTVPTVVLGTRHENRGYELWILA